MPNQATGFHLWTLLQMAGSESEDSDSEDEERDRYRPEPILEAKDPYLHRPLPYLIGSQAFAQDDDVGLIDLPSGKLKINMDDVLFPGYEFAIC